MQKLLFLKLISTPLLIGAATLAARRWGQAVGGWVVGLPLTSGPISVFLALEQGPRFAAEAASATLLGLTAVAAFCLAYRCVLSVAPGPAAVTALVAYLVVAWLVSWLSLGTATAAALVLVVLAVAVAALGRPAASGSRAWSPWWDLPLRMTVATALVVAITSAASLLGPRWSGLLSPFPVFACVMALFAHRASGPKAAHSLLRGVLIGSFAFAAFFVVVATSVQRAGIVTTYGLALVLALGVNALSLLALLRERRGSRLGEATSA